MNDFSLHLPTKSRRQGADERSRARVSKATLRLKARRNPRQERSRQTVEAIVEAAGRLLVEHGRAAVTTNAVAQRAWVSIGSVYQYFPNKDSIFSALQERHRGQVMPLIRLALARLEDPAEDLVLGIVSLMKAMAELNRDDPGRMRALDEDLLERSSATDIQAFADAIAGLLAARTGCSEDSLRPTAWLASLTLTHVGRTLVHHPPPLPMQPILDSLTSMLRGLFSPDPLPAGR